jgi:hypothetical protein
MHLTLESLVREHAAECGLTLSFHISYLKLDSLLSHRRHLIRPNVGIRFLKLSATRPVGRAVPAQRLDEPPCPAFRA